MYSIRHWVRERRARPRAAHRHTYTTVFPHIVLIPKLLFPPSYLPYIILKNVFILLSL